MSEQVRIEEGDHLRGSPNADVVVIEYGDFQCPYSARAHNVLSELQRRLGDRMALVYRHLPLADQHPYAEAAAEAAEAAAAQGKFWEMHDAIFENQDRLDHSALPAIAAAMGLDSARVQEEVVDACYRDRISQHADQARSLGVTGTPCFFINGERYEGDSDRESLAPAIEGALKH